jgi:serine/threonine-protein kinase
MSKQTRRQRRRAQALAAEKATRATARSTAQRTSAERRCGRYELLQSLGAGGMAEIFKARLTGPAGFHRDVVLKRLLAANADDQEFVNMFTDEARILGVLHHPNIVQALDFGSDDARPFLVLEYLEGPSLARVLRARRPVPPVVAAYVGREICRALDYMHRFRDADGTPLGLVHRDVTPSNIILTPAGAVKLLDFGIAKFAKALQSTQSGVIKGKSGYLSPEQLRGATDIDGRVDLFALAVVLYELLTGQRLFAGENDLLTMKNVLHMKIAPPSRANPAVPRGLERVVLRALERDRARRYASAAEMARELDDVILAAGLRVDEVVAFVREVERPPVAPRLAGAPAAAGNDLATRRDLMLPMRLWMSGPRSARRAALVAGLGVALGAAGAFGWSVRGASQRARPIEHGGAVATAR